MPLFKYQEEKSSLFGIIKRPLVELDIYSKKLGKWVPFKRVLADTGADICLLPRFMGNLLVEEVTTGIYKRIRGIVPNTYLNGFIHDLRIRMGNKEFTAPVFIADSEDVTPIFGRGKALDLFKACFDGNSTSIEEK
ncbi:retroviral-like aspartic protease [Candidatus Woesearchaeota archaeon]|nr:retroviral-like aspartic protease [Candidatus Woesearchaeota archaeon]